MDHKSAVANSLLTTVFFRTSVMFGLLATVLIAMKAARMLSEPSSWTDADPEYVSIDLTFSIKSLYETLTDLVERFFGQFNGTSLEEADATLDILHGWGGRKTGDGIYYRLSSQMQDVRYKNYSLASREYPDADDLQEPMAKEVLEAEISHRFGMAF